MAWRQLPKQQPQRRGLKECSTEVIGLSKCRDEGKSVRPWCACRTSRLHHPGVPGIVAKRKGKRPTALEDRNESRDSQPQHGIFLFLLGISLLGWLKVLNGEICSVTTLAHQKYHVNLKIHRKKKSHFIGVIATAFGNLQVCYSALEILSCMHIWRECYPTLALILSWDMRKSNYHHSLLDSFAKEKWQVSQSLKGTKRNMGSKCGGGGGGVSLNKYLKQVGERGSMITRIFEKASSPPRDLFLCCL